MAFAPVTAVVLAASLAPAEPVVGGEEGSFAWPKDVAHVRSAAGTVLSWGDRKIRWRAPDVCAPVSIALAVQSADGTEESFAVAVTPGSGTATHVTWLPGQSTSDWEVLAKGEGRPITLAASEGALTETRAERFCWRGRWRLASTRRPSLEIVAAFAGAELLAWSALPRPGIAAVVVEASPGAPVSVLVEGRRFAGTAGADGVARVAVEVPPGVDRAIAIGPSARAIADLSPPPPKTEHRLTAPDGATWIFQTDAVGRSADGVPPEGSVRVAPGVHRIAARAPAILADANTVAEPPSSQPSVVDSPTTPPAASPAPAIARSVDRSARTDLAWRVIGGTAIGPDRKPSGWMVLLRQWRGPAGTRLGAAAGPLGGLSRHDTTSGAEARRIVLGALAWGELSAPYNFGRMRLSPVIGFGGAASLRRITLAGQQPSDQWLGTILGKAALRAGLGSVDLEVGALVSPVPVGVESARLLGTAGVSWGWQR